MGQAAPKGRVSRGNPRGKQGGAASAGWKACEAPSPQVAELDTPRGVLGSAYIGGAPATRFHTPRPIRPQAVRPTTMTMIMTIGSSGTGGLSRSVERRRARSRLLVAPIADASGESRQSQMQK